MATVTLPYAGTVVRDLPGTGERVYVVCALLLASGAFLNLRSDPEVDVRAGMPFMQVLWALAYLLLIVLIRQKCRGCLRALARQPFLWLPVLWAVASVFWSGEPGLTFRRGATLVLTTLFGTYVGLRFTRSEFLRLLVITCGVIAGSSLIFGALGLGTPVDQAPGWYGVFVQKNSLGRMMAFAVLVLLIAYRAKVSSPKRLLFGLVLCTLLLGLSRSLTAVTVTGLIVLLLITAPLLRKSLSKLILGLLALGCAGTTAVFWVLANLEFVADIIGRSITMTGRLQLWAASFIMALRRPWLGYGYSAFWLGLDGPSRHVWKMFSWHPPHPHNGLLAVWLDLGLIGVGLLAAAYLVFLTKALRLYRRTNSPHALWPLGYLLFFMFANLTESSVMTANGFFWVLFIATAIRLTKTNSRVSLLNAGLVSDSQPERFA